MTNVSSEVHRSARAKLPELNAPIPAPTRWLAYMSTSRWRHHPPVHPAVAQIATAMEAEGWMIRGAWTRNYLLWRNGRTMREKRLPLLVLPLAYARLSTLQINVFLAVEIIQAKFRFHRAVDETHAPAEAEELQAVISLVGGETGVAVADPFRLHREAALGLASLTH